MVSNIQVYSKFWSLISNKRNTTSVTDPMKVFGSQTVLNNYVFGGSTYAGTIL